MSDDQDYSQLPVEEKIAHGVWKVRLDGYTSLIGQFENSRNDADPCFAVFNSKPDNLKSLVLDTNVVAQETAVLAVCKYLEYGCSAASVTRVRNSGLMPALCEKGLASSRAGTKAKSADAILLLADISGAADWIVEQITPYLENRLPKLVSGCVNALQQLVLNFGCVIVPPKLIIPFLAKLFAHADRNVRAETTKLTVALYVWLRAGLTQQLFPSLKPVQQRDLKAEFAKVEDEKPEQIRLTRAQREELALRQQTSTEATGDVQMADAEEVATASAPDFDPFDMLEPVEVLSKLPADLYTRTSSAKWKERVEALEEAQLALSKAPKLANDDYSDLVRLFAKCFKDANIQVVQLAANGTEALAKGLKEAFSKYRALVLTPIIERSKEKKPAVADALANALDAIFVSSSLSDVLDEALAGMHHKTPQVKISATNFLQRCLANTTVAPRTAQVDQIMQVGIKLLTDSQEPIRQAATEMVGTLIKITGERELKSLVGKVDENRRTKVKAVFESASVKISGVSSIAQNTIKRPESTPKTNISQPRLGVAPALKKSAPSQSIPSKRIATSPAKRTDLGTKVPVKSFTGRSLISPSANGAPSVPKSRAEPPAIPPQMLEDMRALKEENRRLKEENESGSRAQATLMDDLRRLKQENSAYSEKLDQLYRDNTNGNLMVKQKDTQIMRLSSDLESAKLKIKSLEQTIEMMKLQQSSAQTQSSQPLQRDAFTSPFASPKRFSSSRLSSHELSTRVDRLSIENGAAFFNNSDETKSNSAEDQCDTGFKSASALSADAPTVTESKNVGGGEENWRKATEVTAQLKARIEKMKQRNRLVNR
ncbi:hypothetical protein OXX59_004875 [Metschnikowia pulcherrima]